MKINHLTLINYRKFQHQSFVFNDYFTAIIGDNATGKTQVLEAVVTLFSEYQFKMMRTNLSSAKEGDMEVHTEILVSDVHHENQAFTAANGTHQVRMEYLYPAIISATINDKDYVFCRRDDADEKANQRDSKLERIAQGYLEKIQKQENVVLPILAYYGTRRLWNKRNVLKDGLPSRTDGYRWSLDSYVDFKELKEWFKKQVLIQLQKGTNGTVLKVMREALVQMIPGCENVFYDFELDELVLHFSKDTALPFDESVVLFTDLSDGYRMVLTMAFDIVKQMVLLNPNLGEAVLHENDGIILIDELDLSLHPKWQRIVVDALKQTFPKVQFIVTTHSPFIIQALSADEVIDLSECKGTVINEHWTSLKNKTCKSNLPIHIKATDLIDMQCLGQIWPAATQSEQIGKSIEDITENVMGVEMPQRSERLQKMYNVAGQGSLNTHVQGLNTSTCTVSPDVQQLPIDLQKLLSNLKERVRNKNEIRQLILKLCKVRPMTKNELSKYLKRREDYLKHLFLIPMIASGELRFLYPEMVKHPSQAYITNVSKETHHE